MSVTAVRPFKVGDWYIEPELLQISKDEEVRKLEFKTMEILLCLVEKQGEVVSKQKLHDEVWSGVYVTDNALTKAVSKLRKAFDDDPLNPKYIDTISKSGYLLLVPPVFNSDDNSTSKSIVDRPTESSTKNLRWLWGLIAIVVITGLSLVSSLSRDVYSEFYDPVPVSTLVGPEVAHSISPDGKKISFTYSEPGANNPDVYVKLLDDLSQVNYTASDSPAGYGIWSPDGSYMAYASIEDGTCGIYKQPSIGGEKTRIGDCFNSPDDFVWSPDGKTIAFTDQRSAQETTRIFFLDVEKHELKEAMSLEEGVSDRDPAFSPDGKFLVFRRTLSGQGRDIYRLRLEDQELTRLTFDNARILGLDIFNEGKQVAFSSNRGGIWALWKVPFDGGMISRFHINDRVPTEPRFASNGKRMIYKSIRDEIRLWAYEKADSDFKPPVELAASTRADIHPSLSQNGNKLVFISNRSGNFEIWSSDLSDHSTTKLTSLEGSFLNKPAWSPDGSEVVFDARVDDGNAIYILDVASKLIRTFVDLDGDQVNAQFSRNGRSIYFASNHSGTWQIWKKPVNGKRADLEQVTFKGGYFIKESPNDHSLFYTRSDTSGIWKRTPEGNEDLFISELSDVDWGNWHPVEDGIVYVDRSFGTQVFHQSYDKNQTPTILFAATKRIQSWSPSLMATDDGRKIVLAQIESSEDEIMMVDFQ